MSETIDTLVGKGFLPQEILEIILLHSGEAVLGKPDAINSAINQIRWEYLMYQPTQSYDVGAVLFFENRYTESLFPPKITLEYVHDSRKINHDPIGVVVGKTKEGFILVKRTDSQEVVTMVSEVKTP